MSCAIGHELLALLERYTKEEKFTQRSEAARSMLGWMIGITGNEIEADALESAAVQLRKDRVPKKAVSVDTAVQLLRTYAGRARSR